MSPKYNGSYQAAKEDCSRKQCQVPGCLKLRNGIGKYCKQHGSATSAWGHPLAVAIQPKEFTSSITQARELLEKNAEHPGVVHCLSFLQRYMDAADQGSTRVPASVRMSYLSQAGVTPMDILSRVAAVYLDRLQDHTHVLDDRHAKYLMAHLVLRLVCTPGLPWIKGVHRRTVGDFLAAGVGTLCLNLATSVREQELKKEHERNLMVKPLSL